MEAKDKFTLGLELPTDPRWVDIARQHLADILTDHAYCEQKAASSCISLIVQYPHKDHLVAALTPIVAEEWNHFQRVVDHLRKRGYILGSPRKDIYVERLAKVMRKSNDRDQVLVEKLLMNAMIEARSCERFKILYKNIGDEELSDFYYELMVSEAGHYKNFIQLAKTFAPDAEVMTRWREWLEAEAEIVQSLQTRGDRMH